MSENLEAPVPKRPRTEDEPPLSFVVSDDAGERLTVIIRRDMCRKIPYLDRKVSTKIGDANNEERGTVALPPGCSVPTFAALVHRVETPNDFVRSAELVAHSMDDAIALLRTADFLLLEEVVPEILLLCKRHIATDEDVARLKSLPLSGIQELSRELTGGNLVKIMDAADASSLAEAMCCCVSTDRVCNTQVKVLYDWLRAETRSEEDLETVLAPFQYYTGRYCWGFERDGKIHLKQGAEQKIQAFAVLASERPPYFRLFEDFTEDLSRCLTNDFSPEFIENFVRALLHPFDGRSITMDELEKLLPLLLRRPFIPRDMDGPSPFLDMICSHSYTAGELRVVLWAFSSLELSQSYGLAAKLIRILTNSELKGVEYGIDLLMRCHKWVEAVTVPFLNMLAPESRLKLIGKILPWLHSGASAEVKKYIDDAIASGEL